MKLRNLMVVVLLSASQLTGGAEGILDSLKSGVQSATNAVSGMIEKALPDDGKEGVPRRIAVLPATGDGSAETLEDIRTAIHNGLGSKNFDLQKMQEVDRNLKYLEQSLGGSAIALPSAQLVKKLDLDGVLYLNVPSIQKVYTGVYAHQEVTVHLRLIDADGKLIWEKTDSTIERDGGISLNPLSILATAIGSAKVLTSGTQQALVDRLARRFAVDIPNPKGARKKVVPPKIEVALSNAADGPFHSGEEIKVYMKAEAGLIVTFDVGQMRQGVRVEEKGAGEYVGRYVVGANDNGDDLSIILRVQRLSDRQDSDWRVPGNINIDTLVPGPVEGLRLSATAKGIQLVWRPPAGKQEKLIYQIERADPVTGIFSALATMGVTEYLDQNTQPGLQYHYRIHAIDSARNHGVFTEEKVLALKSGPTPVTGELNGIIAWHALSSPYVLDGAVRLARNAVLIIEPGTTIQMQPRASLEIQGQLRALGQSDAQITLLADQARVQFNGGSPASELAFIRLSGQGGQIQIAETAVNFSDCSLNQFDTALLLNGGAEVNLSRCTVYKNKQGIVLGNARLKLNSVVFRENGTALDIETPTAFMAEQLQFESNEQHVATRSVIVLGSPLFRDQTYPEVQSRLKGDVRINWEAMPVERNLRGVWLSTLWQRYFQAQQAKSAVQAERVLGELQQFDEPVAVDLLQVYQLIRDQKVQASEPLAFAYQNALKDARISPRLWLQEVKLPWRANLTSSENYLLNQAQSKFNSTYLSSDFPEAEKAKQQITGLRIDAARHILKSRFLRGQREGLYYKYWVAHVVNRAAVTHELLLAGIIKRDKARLTVGLVNMGEQYQAQQRIAGKLDAQGLPLVNLGQGEYGAALRARAQQQGAQVVLETSYKLKVTSSQLSSNFKQYEVALQVSLYDLGRGVVLNRFTADGRSTDFRAKEGQEKALEDAMGQIERDLVIALWAAEDRLPVAEKGDSVF